MNKEFWHGRRAPGIADQIDLTRYNNLVEVIEEAFKNNGDKNAYTGIGHTLTYADLDRLSDQFCRYLQYHTDLKPGDRIAIQMANLLQYPVVVYGALRAGLVIVNTNPLYTEREMLHQFKDSGAKALVFMQTFGDKVEKILSQTAIKTVISTNLADLHPFGKRIAVKFLAKYVKKIVPDYNISSETSFRSVLAMGNNSPPAITINASSEDCAVLQYTGGTTGVAKGAILSHKNLIANMLQINTGLEQVDENAQPLLNKGEEIIITPLPLYHIYAFTVHLMSAASLGNHNILVANPRDPKLFVKAIKAWPFTVFVGLNTLFVALMKQASFRQLDFSQLKVTISGGTALASDTELRWSKLTGCRIGEGYGLTECAPVVCSSASGDFTYPGSIGLPVAGTSLKIVDVDANELPFGEAGELCVKGPQVMSGYWNVSKEECDAFDQDDWFKTGDIATIDDEGIVRIIDRLKDMVIVSGFNVYPNEIEAVVVEHPLVEQAAVIGVEDKVTGEAVKLFVVAKQSSLDEKTLLEFCRTHLTAYKVPKLVEFRDELPMSPIGKVLRKELRAMENKTAMKG